MSAQLVGYPPPVRNKRQPDMFLNLFLKITILMFVLSPPDLLNAIKLRKFSPSLLRKEGKIP